MVERFGPGIVAPDGTLDRPAVADIVFNDAEALKDLGAIVHPAVGVEIARRLEAERDTDHLVVLDVPAARGVRARRHGRARGRRRRPGGRGRPPGGAPRHARRTTCGLGWPARCPARSGWPRPTSSSTTPARRSDLERAGRRAVAAPASGPERPPRWPDAPGRAGRRAPARRTEVDALAAVLGAVGAGRGVAPPRQPAHRRRRRPQVLLVVGAGRGAVAARAGRPARRCSRSAAS